MWVYESVPRLRLGRGALNTLGEEARPFGPGVALICGRHAVAGGIAARAEAALQEVGIGALVIEGPRQEPTVAEAARALALARGATCSLVVGIGGGSVLDVAKAVAGLYYGAGEPLALVTASLYGKPPEHKALPWIAVPTTAGTGSEATHVCVLSDPERGSKQSMRSSRWYARCVIIDPALYATAPPKVTASAGMDALTQAIEAHTSLGATPVTQALSLRAAALVGEHLLPAYRHGDDLSAREGTALGSCLAGMALTNARLGAVHGLAHPLGIRYGLPHGFVCAVVLPHVMRFNLPVAARGYSELALALGLPGTGGVHPLLAFVEQLRQQLDIPDRLGPLGMRAEHIPALVRDSLPSGSTKANPRPVSPGDLEGLLADML